MSRLTRYLRFHVHGVIERAPRKSRRAGLSAPVRDWKYRAWIRSLPCAACGCLRFVEAAHTGSDGGMRQKPGDYSTVPLCAVCHRVGPRSYHQVGKLEFQTINRLDFGQLAERLYENWRNGLEHWE